MVRVDCAINKYVANFLKETYDWVLDASADCVESFGLDDIMISAGTIDSYTGIPVESKSIKGGWQIKKEGEWNDYFTSGIYNKLRFEGESLSSGTPIYFVNQTKYKRLMDTPGACLVYAAPDGILLYNHKQLKEAFKGYADYYVKHTTELGDRHMQWETKALLDMSKAKYLPWNAPKELFEK